jgi:hypothetical protein
MRKLRLLVAFVTLALSATLCAASPQAFLLTFDIGGNQGTASLLSNSLGGGQYWATSGTLNVTAGADVGTYSLFSGGPSTFSSPSGAFIADNVLYSPSDPVLDVYGLLFSGSGLEINIWGNSPGNYSFYSWDGSGFNVAAAGPSTVSLQPVPEPASMLLLGNGLLILGGAIRKKMLR